jgi:uncharacterized membrane protein YozB (DUF420 family)
VLLIADSILPHVNASLNALALVVLIIGYSLIRARKETAHKIAMISCFVISVVFLACYLTYHYGYGHTIFDRAAYPTAAIIYYALLATHVPLAAVIPILAMITIYLGWTDQRAKHRRLAKWTFPIWLYVSITGVLVYFMIYWWFPPLTTMP